MILNAVAIVPNLTRVAPEKNVPLIVTELPVIPEVGVNDVIVGGEEGVIVNFAALVTVPVGAEVLATVTNPVVVPAATFACSWVGEFSFTDVAATPLTLTVELALNPTPLTLRSVPIGPEAGSRAVIDKVGVNLAVVVALPARFSTVIVLGPMPFGTVAVI